MALSVVVPTRNRPTRSTRLVRALVEQSRRSMLADEIEIVVVDDGSSAQAARTLADAVGAIGARSVRLIALRRHVGPGQARNLGFEASRGSVVAFLDDDLMPAESYLFETLTEHSRHSEALVINGDIGTTRRDLCARVWLSRYDAVFNASGDSFRPIHALSSGHFSIKRVLADCFSPLFESTLRAREDFDLFLRLEQAGIPVFKSNRIKALNDPRRSLWGLMKQHAWYGRGEYALRRLHSPGRIEAAQRRARVDAAPSFPLVDAVLALAFHAGFRWEAFCRERDVRALLRGVDVGWLLRAPGRLYRRWVLARAGR